MRAHEMGSQGGERRAPRGAERGFAVIERDLDGFVIMDLLPDGESDAGYVDFSPPPPLAEGTWHDAVAVAVDADMVADAGGYRSDDRSGEEPSDVHPVTPGFDQVHLDQGAIDLDPATEPDDVADTDPSW